MNINREFLRFQKLQASQRRRSKTVIWTWRSKLSRERFHFSTAIGYDYTAITVVGIDAKELYLLHVDRGQAESQGRFRVFVSGPEICVSRKPETWFAETRFEISS